MRAEGPKSRNPLAFKYYNAEQVVAGKPMKEWLRFAVAYWHTWRGNGADIFGLDGSYGDRRPWDMAKCVRMFLHLGPFASQGDVADAFTASMCVLCRSTLDAALARVDVHFEFCEKLGVPFYCFHDRDICPEGSSVEETNAWMDQVADRLEAGQRATGVKLLWGTCAT